MATSSSSTSSAAAAAARATGAVAPFSVMVRGRWRAPVLVGAVAAVGAAMLRRFATIRLVPVTSGLSPSAFLILGTVFVGFVVLCLAAACVPNYYYAHPTSGTKATSKSATRIKSRIAAEEEKDAAGDVEFVVPPVRIKDAADNGEDGGGGRRGSPPFVLSSDLAQQVAERVLPTHLADYTWIRVYSLSRDGDSFVTFMKAVEDLECTLLVLRTQRGSVVGAFADSSWTNAAKGPAAFRGGPKTRLFRVCADDGGNAVECYAWTGANRYCQLCDVRRRRIAFGGGSGGGGGDEDDDKDETKGSSSFGLTLERDFLEGTTSACPTFNNPPLCEEHFAIVELEVFGFRLWW
jgi:TLD